MVQVAGEKILKVQGSEDSSVVMEEGPCPSWDTSETLRSEQQMWCEGESGEHFREEEEPEEREKEII